MWYTDDHALRYSIWWDDLHLSFLVPDWSVAPREIESMCPSNHLYLGYDDWVQRYPREDEIRLVVDTINALKESPRPVHIAGISCAESIELISEYYRAQWYENTDAKNYSIPADTLLTVSTSLRHILWCEKDKTFLSKKDTSGVPYYAISPPVRSPSDLRTLQQASRSGIIMGISLLPGDEPYFSQIFEKQILTPFQLSQLIFYRWKRFWFSGEEQNFSLLFPDFSQEVDSTISRIHDSSGTFGGKSTQNHSGQQNSL